MQYRIGTDEPLELQHVLWNTTSQNVGIDDDASVHSRSFDLNSDSHRAD